MLILVEYGLNNLISRVGSNCFLQYHFACLHFVSQVEIFNDIRDAIVSFNHQGTLSVRVILSQVIYT